MSLKISRFLYLMFFALIPFTLKSQIEISLDPSPIVAGEAATLSIKSDEGVAEIIDIPDIPNVQWLNKTRTGSNVMVINGKRFDITTYSFIVEKPGKISMPSFKIRYNGEEIETQPKEISARSGALSEIDKYIFIEPKFNLKGKVYTGQSVQLEVFLFKALDIDAMPTSYPQISIDNVLFDNFSSKNKENERFAPYPYYPPEKAERDSVGYIKSCFMTSFRAMSPGKIKGIISIPVDISVPDSSASRHSFLDNNLVNGSMFDDPFFNRNKHMTRMISTSIPELDILPLPKEPDSSSSLGLFGKWDCSITASPDKLAEGETLTIKVNISGYGSIETLTAPELNIPGFTSYKPEIEKHQAIDLSGDKSKAVITYLLIPKQAGKNEVAFSFCTFNTLDDKYNICSLKKSVEVVKNSNLTATAIQSAPVQNYGNLIANDEKKKIESDSILYIKKNTSKTVLIPLWKNYLPYYICLIILGPLIFVISELLRKKKAISTEALLRKQKAMKRRGKILRELNSRKDSDFVNYIDSDVVPFINDVSGFPPGTTSYELASKLSDDAFSDCLDQTNKSRYMPHTDTHTERELKAKLSKCLKKIHLLILSSALFFCSLNSNASSSSEFVSEYNKGNFVKAEEICLKNINASNPSPAWLYNLGNAYTQDGKLAQALASYERALLLDPRDQDVLQNLNFVRRLLFLPEAYQKGTPFELLIYFRDILRPDEWLLLGAVLFFVLFIVLTTRRRLSNYSFASAVLLLGVLVIVSIGVYFNQTGTIYSDKNAIITIRNPIIHSLPAADSSEVKINLAIGDDVKIQDKMDDWTLITSKDNKTIGWVKNDSVEQIWQY